MKTLFRWAIRIAVTLFCLLVLLVVLAVILKDTIAKSLVEKGLRDGTGLDAQISKLEISLTTPTVNLEGLKLYNQPEFGGGTFLDLPELRVEYMPGDLWDRKIHFKTVRVSIAEIHLIKGKDGKTNLDRMNKEVRVRAKEKKKAGGSNDAFGGIDALYLSIGKIRITDEADPRNNTEMNVSMKEEVGKNLKNEEAVQNWFNAVIFRTALRAKAARDSQLPRP